MQTGGALVDTCYRLATHGLVKADNLTLAGELVPLHTPAVRRRLEREMRRVMQYPTQAEEIANRARHYFKIIDPILKQCGIPRDFRYVMAVESAFDHRVVSRRGATGLWQLMHAPATASGLAINNEVDERLHLQKSTHAVARHLRLLHRYTGSWTGALAAYNCGLSRYQRIAKRTGTKSYYHMATGRETNQYVYKVLAIKELLERPAVYGLALHKRPSPQPDVRLVRVAKPEPSLDAFAQRFGTTLAGLRALNPWLVGKSLTPTEGAYLVAVPRTRPAVSTQTIAATQANIQGLALVADSGLARLN